MSKKQKKTERYDMRKEKIEEFIRLYKESGGIIDELRRIIDIAPESKLSESVYRLAEGYLEVLAESIGDKSGWLSWFIYDNDMGKNEYQAGYDNKFRKIKSVDDLLLIMDEHDAT